MNVSLSPEHIEKLRALVADYLRNRFLDDPQIYVTRTRTRESLLLDPLMHANAIVKKWRLPVLLDFLNLDSPVYLEAVVDELGFDPRTGGPPQRAIVASDERDTLIKLRTSTPLTPAQKADMGSFLGKRLALSGRTEVEVI